MHIAYFYPTKYADKPIGASIIPHPYSIDEYSYTNYLPDNVEKEWVECIYVSTTKQ